MAGPGAPVTGDDLRGVFRRVPAGVAVVTVDHDGERLGLTVASVVSLSLEPPLVAVSIARQAAMHEILRGAGRFAVTFLAAGDEGARLAAHFARGVPPIAMWHGVALRERPAGAELGAAAEPGAAAPAPAPPQLAAAAGWLDCTVTAELPAGDHTLFVAAVEAAETGPAARSLVHVEGRSE